MVKQTLVIAPARRPRATIAGSRHHYASALQAPDEPMRAIRRDQRKGYRQAIERAENEGLAIFPPAFDADTPAGAFHWPQAPHGITEPTRQPQPVARIDHSQ